MPSGPTVHRSRRSVGLDSRNDNVLTEIRSSWAPVLRRCDSDGVSVQVVCFRKQGRIYWTQIDKQTNSEPFMCTAFIYSSLSNREQRSYIWERILGDCGQKYSHCRFIEFD